MPDQRHEVGLLRRIDVQAAIDPKRARRRILISAGFIVWLSIGLIAAVVRHRWTPAAMLAPTLLLLAAELGVRIRAQRRIPQTKKWIDERLQNS